MLLAALLWAGGEARADPLLTSWFTTYSAKYARVQQTNGGALVATWPSSGLPNNNSSTASQTNPVYSDVQRIRYSLSNVYINAGGVASYTMGPWYGNAAQTQVWGFWPLSQNYTSRITRFPTTNGTKERHGGGPIGTMVNGVAIYDLGDAFGFVQSANTPVVTGNDVMGQTAATNPWWRNALAVEQVTFDPGFAHQPGLNGQYHYHAEPKALRYQLGDNMLVTTNMNTQAITYVENLANTNLQHSPILGWCFDGYPIYGPYGYSVTNDPGSPISRMRTGFVLRNGSNGTTDLNTSGRKTLPKWAAIAEGVANPTGTNPLTLSNSAWGPSTSYATTNGPPGNTTTNYYTLGRYVGDFDYLGDLIKSGSERYQQGVDFDLDQYNGRWCVTPEYPGGIYAYFVTMDTNGTPVFPYMLSKQYFGIKNGEINTNVPSSGVTNYFSGGPNTQEVMQAPVLGGGDVTLVWSSVEGGTYQVQASRSLSSNWTNLSTNFPAATNAITTSYVETNAAGSYPQSFYRVGRTALAPYSP
ncbi:MAG: YHYH protein [Chthoniobacterales bacterium]